MKTALNSLIVAFSMYSNIPVPSKKMDDKGMRYAMCFFPMVGVIIGALVMLWQYLSSKFEVNSIICAAVSVAIPVLITGGIHLDGYLDTVDALSSHKSTEDKLQILKDPHAGAFAIIYGCVYFLLYFSMWTQINFNGALILSIGFVLSRSLSALSVATFIPAKKSGLLYAFASESHRKMVRMTSVLYMVACVAAFILVDRKLCIFAAAAAALAFLVYRLVAYTQFNGITGDLAGYFLSLCELFMAIATFLGVLLCY